MEWAGIFGPRRSRLNSFDVERRLSRFSEASIFSLKVFEKLTREIIQTGDGG
jgi:hypothetical protein